MKLVRGQPGRSIRLCKAVDYIGRPADRSVNRYRS